MYWNYNLGIFNYCMNMGDLAAYISVHHVHASTYAGQKRAQGSWEPEVQTVVRLQVDAGDWTPCLLEEKQVLLTSEQESLGSSDVLEGDLWALVLPSLHGPPLLSPLAFFPAPSPMLRQGSMTKPEWCSCNYNLKYVFLPPKLFVPCIFDTAKENQLTLKQRIIF